MKIKRFYDEVYKIPFIIVPFANETDLDHLKIDNLSEHYPIWGMTLEVKGETKYTEGRGIYILIKQEAINDMEDCVEVAIHESFHAASMVLHSAGIELTEDTEEVYAYYVTWVTRKVLGLVVKMENK